jgi:hypothetical protein
MAPLALTEILFRAGAGPGKPPLDLPISPMTVLVGPNGSGKSRTMLEFEEWARGRDILGSVTRGFRIQWPSSQEAREMLRPYEVTEFLPGRNQPGQGAFRVESPGIANPGPQLEIGEESIQAAFAAPLVETYSPSRRSYLLTMFVARLTGRDRFNLVNAQPLGNLRRPLNHLAVLFSDDEKRQRIRNLVHEAFGLYFVLDPTSEVGNVHIRFSTSPPTSSATERGLGEESVRFHGEARPVEAMSDGVQAYTALLVGAFSLAHRVIPR